MSTPVSGALLSTLEGVDVLGLRSRQKSRLFLVTPLPPRRTLDRPLCPRTDVHVPQPRQTRVTKSLTTS